MTGSKLVGYHLRNTTSVSVITSNRIWHGLKPQQATMPCINYFRVGYYRLKGVEREEYTLNCRARKAEDAQNLAREAVEAFTGSSGTGITATINGFDVARGSFTGGAGNIIPEEPGPRNGAVYNAPVTIAIVFQSDTVS